ncbi:chymotrypsin-2-like [Phymastichus coffea]|uniref:chymotrypsin-2-like n=1 Tax=Phymastichus coffea TaxID=108790 RepID=UPI00273BC62C|nr:chymotrypsin-2-like [Phymastichus coffea]
MLNRIVFFTFLYATLFDAISEQNPIIGQTVDVERDEFQKDFGFMASLGDLSILGVHKKWESHQCSGILISKRHVLTASHCLHIQEFHKIMVTFGSTDLNCGISYEVKSWINYTNWAVLHGIKVVTDLLFYDDIGIIMLSHDVNHIQPAVISKLNDNEVIGKQVITVGWGIIDKKKNIRPRKMQKVYLNVLDSTKCDNIVWESFGYLNVTHSNRYCTHADLGAFICCGDSGGPLILYSTKEIVGIVSYVFERKKFFKKRVVASVYIKLKDYEHFINDVIKT